MRAERFRLVRQILASQYLGRGEALRQVQLGMLKKNPKLHPFYWANLDGKR